MISSLPALSLSSTFTEVGALASFVALLGIALLALLCFSQAREIKRLREWAGRAPERAAELEQRVVAQRAQQRVVAQPVPGTPAPPVPPPPGGQAGLAPRAPGARPRPRPPRRSWRPPRQTAARAGRRTLRRRRSSRA